jgi:hypothetical protein
MPAESTVDYAWSWYNPANQVNAIQGRKDLITNDTKRVCMRSHFKFSDDICIWSNCNNKIMRINWELGGDQEGTMECSTGVGGGTWCVAGVFSEYPDAVKIPYDTDTDAIGIGHCTDNWCSFEMCISSGSGGGIKAGLDMTVEVHIDQLGGLNLSNVAGPLYVGNSQAGSTLRSVYIVDLYRERGPAEPNDITGTYGLSHMMQAQWDTDTGIWIGPAYEIEKVGRDYYVDDDAATPNGVGSIQDPFQDIDKCVDMVAGDTCYINSGYYNAGWRAYAPNNSGTPGNLITYSGYPGLTGDDRPLIEELGGYEPISRDSGRGACSLGWWDEHMGTDYIRYTNLRVQGTICLYGSHEGNTAKGNVIDNNEIWGGSWSYDYTNVNGIYQTYAEESHIYNNYIHHIITGSRSANWFKGCINWFDDGGGTIIEHNRLAYCGSAIYMKDSALYGMIIRHNLIQAPKHGIWGTNQEIQTGIEIYENIIDCTLSTSEYGADFRLDTNDGQFYNNTIVDCRGDDDKAAITYGSGSDGAADTDDWDIYNNIIWTRGGSPARMFYTNRDTNDGSNMPAVLDYNIWHNEDGAVRWANPRYQSDLPYVFYSSLESWSSATGFDTHSLTSDPQFVSESTGDYHLAEGSPGEGAGLGGVDIGAYPRGDDGTVIGIDPALAPGGPTPSPSPTPTPGGPSPSPTPSPSPSPTAEPTPEPSTDIELGCPTSLVPNPAWLMCENFETEDFDDQFFEYQHPNDNFVRSADTGMLGSTSMRATYPIGVVNIGSLKYGFGRAPYYGYPTQHYPNTDYREIYWREYIYMESPFNETPEKFSRITSFVASDWSQSMVAHLWGNDGTKLKTQPTSCVTDGEIDCVAYNDTTAMQWLSHNPGTTEIFASAQNDQWICVEGHVKLNTVVEGVAQNDGIQEFWIGDVLERREDTLNYVGTYDEYALNVIMFEAWKNEGASAELVMHRDNWVVSTERIYCEIVLSTIRQPTGVIAYQEPN